MRSNQAKFILRRIRRAFKEFHGDKFHQIRIEFWWNDYNNLIRAITVCPYQNKAIFQRNHDHGMTPAMAEVFYDMALRSQSVRIWIENATVDDQLDHQQAVAA